MRGIGGSEVIVHKSGETVNILFGRELFRLAGLLYATAASGSAPSARAFKHIITINTPDPAHTRSLTAGQLVCRAVYMICFSPAFIFANLSRGPP